MVPTSWAVVEVPAFSEVAALAPALALALALAPALAATVDGAAAAVEKSSVYGFPPEQLGSRPSMSGNRI